MAKASLFSILTLHVLTGEVSGGLAARCQTDH
jgi:hypothetical protein